MKKPPPGDVTFQKGQKVWGLFAGDEDDDEEYWYEGVVLQSNSSKCVTLDTCYTITIHFSCIHLSFFIPLTL